MANIPAISPLTAIGATTVAPVPLGVSNTLLWNASAKSVLFLQNTSGASVNATLDGSLAPATIPVAGTGATFNSAPGAVVPIPAGAIVAIPLSNYRAYLVGNVTLALSLATGMTGWLLEV